MIDLRSRDVLPIAGDKMELASLLDGAQT